MIDIDELKYTDGTFMSTVDGGYPVIYFDLDNNVLCAKCASAEPEGSIEAYEILYEGSEMCDECYTEIQA